MTKKQKNKNEIRWVWNERRTYKKLEPVPTFRTPNSKRPLYRCHYCKQIFDKDNITIDHKLPKSKGGTNRLSNCVRACKPCNQRKGSMTYEEYMAHIGKPVSIG